MVKTPDITPAQIKATVIALAAVLASVGLPLSDAVQAQLIVVGSAVPVALVLADALIRYGRSRVFGAAETMDRAEEPKKPV